MKRVPIDSQFARNDFETHRVLAARSIRLRVSASDEQAQSSKARCAGPPHWQLCLKCSSYKVSFRRTARAGAPSPPMIFSGRQTNS